MKLELLVRKDVSCVELVNDGRYPMGIKLRDGTQGEEGPVIKKIKAKSLGERSHAVAEGDIILTLNDKKMMGSRGKDVQRLLKESGPSINLKVQFEIRELCISDNGVSRKAWITTKLQKDGDSFGFVLRKRDSKHPVKEEYPVISSIRLGGPACKDGPMQEGDRLLKIDDVDLSWLSLADIGRILQERTDAEFTFEYNIKMVDPSKILDRKVHLEIEIPNVDLGIDLCSYSSAYAGICIGSIQLGSVADRCGIFSEGDIILSVNDIDAEFLTVSKANALLRCTTKKRKISFISTKGKELKLTPLLQNGFRHHKFKYDHKSTRAVETQAIDYQHLNTPVSTLTTVSGKHKFQTTEFCYMEQVKAIKIFQDIIKQMMDLKQNLSQLTREAFESKNNIQENCSACLKNQHSVKLCVSCLAKMNVKCAQSMDFLKNMIADFIDVSLKQGNLFDSNTETKEVPVGNYMRREGLKNLIHSLTETLPKVFAGKSELPKTFQALANNLLNADASCNTCKNEIDSASLTVQKLLLLISLNDPSTEIKVLINQLVYCLLETSLTCHANTDSSDTSVNDENSVTESENAIYPPLLTSGDGASSSQNGTSTQQNITKTELNAEELNTAESSLETSPKFPRLSVSLNQPASYFKLTEIISSSGSENSLEKELGENVGLIDNRSKNVAFEKENVTRSEASCLIERSLTSKKSTKGSNKEVNKNKSLLNTPAKIWRSLDTFLNPKKSLQVESSVRNDSHQNSKSCETQNSHKVVSECSFINPPHRLSLLDIDLHSKSNEINYLDSNLESTQSIFKVPTENGKSKEKPKTHTEIVEVNIGQNGEGFGIFLGFSSSNFLDTLPIPVITAIKPKSPAKKVGILAKKDRILAINGQSMVGIPLKDLERLKRTVFVGDFVNLTVEFDVEDVEMKLGTFDVVLDKTLKPGLLFDDIQKGYPMTISGVVKGSAAHRSGQLFPRDKVVFLKCVRNEVFDPFSCNYSREETVTITVQRDLNEGIEESPIPPIPSNTNPFNHNPGTSNQAGGTFILRHTAMRSVEGTDSVVLDQGLTLFRDPISWDFGFLVGENPQTGRAYITDVRPGGPACASGAMKKFDRIMEVNGVAIGKTEECSVLSLLTQSNDKLDLLTRRLYHEEAGIDSPKLKPPPFM